MQQCSSSGIACTVLLAAGSMHLHALLLQVTTARGFSNSSSANSTYVIGVCAGSHGGEHVQVEGSFDNWTTRQQLQRSGREFTVVKLLPPGVYQVQTTATALCSKHGSLRRLLCGQHNGILVISAVA